MQKSSDKNCRKLSEKLSERKEETLGNTVFPRALGSILYGAP